MSSANTPVLHGLSASPHARACRITFAEKNISHVYKDIGFSDLATDEYALINPFRLMPALTTPQGTLYETPALLTWADLSGSGARLQPTDAFAVGSMWKFIGIAQNALYKNGVMQLYFHRVLARVFGIEPDTNVADAAVAPILVALDVIEDSLSDGWLAGGNFSLADIYCGVMVDYVARTHDGRDALASRPKTRAWIDTLRERSSFRETFASMLNGTDQV